MMLKAFSLSQFLVNHSQNTAPLKISVSWIIVHLDRKAAAQDMPQGIL